MCFRVNWYVTRGPRLPEPLVGHCMAEYTPNEFIIAGGFSSKTQDYIDMIYIHNVLTETWTSKPWMAFKHGPRMDASCLTINWANDRKIIMAGGWNNTALFVTETYDKNKERWKTVATNLSDVTNSAALDNSLRSSAIAELNKLPLLAGGVECTGYVVVLCCRE